MRNSISENREGGIRKKMTSEEEKKKIQKKPKENVEDLKAESEFLRQENRSYKSLLNMQNKSYFRAELVEAILKLSVQLEDQNRILLAIHDKQK